MPQSRPAPPRKRHRPFRRLCGRPVCQWRVQPPPARSSLDRSCPACLACWPGEVHPTPRGAKSRIDVRRGISFASVQRPCRRERYHFTGPSETREHPGQKASRRLQANGGFFCFYPMPLAGQKTTRTGRPLRWCPPACNWCQASSTIPNLAENDWRRPVTGCAACMGNPDTSQPAERNRTTTGQPPDGQEPNSPLHRGDVSPLGAAQPSGQAVSIEHLR